MKKVLVLLLVSAAVITACNKDQKINRQLDGEWKTTMYDGQAVEADDQSTMKFEKGKKGVGTVTFTDGTDSYSAPYVIKDEKITITFSAGGQSMDFVYTIKEHSKKKMVWVDEDGTESEMEKI